MAATTTLTIRVDPAVKDRLEAVAKAQKRSKSFLAAEAIAEYLEVQDWQDRRIKQALASADRGEGVAHSRVLSWIAAWDTDDEQALPRV